MEVSELIAYKGDQALKKFYPAEHSVFSEDWDWSIWQAREDKNEELADYLELTKIAWEAACEMETMKMHTQEAI